MRWSLYRAHFHQSPQAPEASAHLELRYATLFYNRTRWLQMMRSVFFFFINLTCHSNFNAECFLANDVLHNDAVNSSV